jgi:transketolase
MAFELGPRRGVFIDISEVLKKKGGPLAAEEVAHRETFDLIYRSLCAILYNYVPMSGHPGGSISSGRFVATALFRTMEYDPSDPERPDADLMSYAAGHKALGLYAMWSLRNEVLRIGAAELLPKNERHQLRLEDLLGFRRNPTTDTPLFRKLHSKALDGHPTPATPFVKLSTGASGVGVPSSLGLAYGARDTYGDGAPRVHIIEGEGGMTPGRVSEALAAAATASLDNAIMHVDWNQASIDSNRVCRDGAEPGDYVQWDPVEFAYLHDWNVILVPDGFDLQQIAAAQQQALTLDTGQPTAIVYRTVKGWKYGIEGRLSHGAGHKLCSPEFFTALQPFTERWKVDLPNCLNRDPRCKSSDAPAVQEECFWETLQCVRRVLESETEMIASFAEGLRGGRKRLDSLARKPRPKAPQLERVFEEAARVSDSTPEELQLKPGASTTLRGALGNALGHYNRKSGGALLAAAADLLGSTSVNASAKGFPDGYYHTTKNPDARILSIGGICEDAISGILSGLSSYGNHIGIGSSYAAFIAPLGHIATRLHAIGNQARQEVAKGPYRTMILICAHAGVKTGEDGPTHADPQPLQLLQGNFPRGTMITLTPWDPQEVWYLLSAALAKRPAVIAPFVTRPNEKVPDRAAMGLAPPHAAAKGVYKLRAARGEADGTLVLQGSEVAYAFVEKTLPLLEKEGIDLNVFYVASAELFDALPQQERDAIFPEHLAREAMGITGFTLPTLYRWVTSARGRAASLYPFRDGHYLGSGQAHMVLKEASLDGEAQLEAIRRYVRVKVS